MRGRGAIVNGQGAAGHGVTSVRRACTPCAARGQARSTCVDAGGKFRTGGSQTGRGTPHHGPRLIFPPGRHWPFVDGYGSCGLKNINVLCE